MNTSYPIEKSSNLIRPLLPVLVTTYSEEYGVNAAPMSSFNFLSYQPPLATVSVHPTRDTYKNIIESGEFVANIASEEILDKLFECARKYERGVNELEKVGLTETPSEKVKPPRIEECVAWVEYKLNEEVYPRNSERSIIVGKPVAAAVKKEILDNGLINPEKSMILVHLGSNIFSSANQILLADSKLRKQGKVLDWMEYMEYITGRSTSCQK